jgi:D-glycero-alpha-D-manno-heptose-7-phosphate kinase
MIISRSPLRISLGGGGTDLESYYSKKGGFLIAAAIDKFIYIGIHKIFPDGFIIKYSKYEKTYDIESIEHPIIREVLKKYFPNGSNLEITSFADIPAGTGLGSSGSFTTALINGILHMNYSKVTADQLAEMACEIEIDILKEPIGKQDQYIASWGGIREFTFHKNGKVSSETLYESEDDYLDLKNNLMLVYTGATRKASSILSEQKEKSDKNDDSMIKNLDKVKKMGKECSDLLKDKRFDEYGKLMNEHWILKKERSKAMSNKKIDELYEFGINNGSNGGKIIGAGGGGFILFQSHNPTILRKKFSEQGIRTIDFNFVNLGTEIINV